MKTLMLLLTLAFAKTTFAQEMASLTIEVENITSDDGKLLVGMYTKDVFLNAEPTFSEEVAIQDGKASLTFTDVPMGEYGIACFHDKNGNQQMDFEPNGMPKEDYGVSNNPQLYGPPTWEDAKFTIDEPQETITIRF